MYVCMCVRMNESRYVCDVLTCLLFPSVWRFCFSVLLFVRMCVNKKVCMYVCTVCMYVCIMYVCMYCMYVCMYVCLLPQSRHCYIASHHQLGICHNDVTENNTLPTCFRGGQVGILNKWNMNTDTVTDTGYKLDFVCMYVCMYVCDALTCLLILFVRRFCLSVPIYV